ncbi:MAG: pitrilysin family protein, partial [Thermodesulfovibrionaceae bacterium]
MKFKTFTLDSGAKIKYFEKTSIPIVYFSVLIKASSLDEIKPSQAYLTAHLLTYGTKTRTARQIEEEIDFLAISIEKRITSDYTIFTLSATKRHLKEALELFFDILKNPIFPKEELEREKTILYKSIKQLEEDPSYIGQKNFMKQLFGEHPYGRPVEGEGETLMEITKEDIVDFYNQFYNPSNMIFSVVGDIDEKLLKEMIIKPISDWQGIKKERKIKPPFFKVRQKPLKININREDLTQSTIILGFEGISRKNPDFYTLTLINYVLGGGGLTSRLARSIREEHGLAYSIYSLFYPYLLSGSFLIEVKTKAENTEKVIDMIVKELEKIKEKGITDEEIKEAKSFLVGSFPLKIDTMKKLAEFLVVVEFYELGDDYIERYPEYINRIT